MSRISCLSGPVAAMLAILSACGNADSTSAGSAQGGSTAASGGAGSGATATGGTSATPAMGGASSGGRGSGGSGDASSGGGASGGVVASGGTSGGGGRLLEAGGRASGGAVASGGATGSGGRLLGAGGNAAGDCSSLWQSYTEALRAARACSPNSTNEQCSRESVLYDVCGCDVPVNPTSEHYRDAVELYSRWKRACPAAACIIACPENPGAPSCKSPSSGQSICSF